MKFLLDVGISPRLGRMLESNEHSFRYLSDFYSGKTTDSDILEIAIDNDEIVITHDLDFGSLLAFSRKNRPSVILFRIHHIQPELFYSLIMNNWSTIEQPLLEGSLVIIESNSIRIRPLPIVSRLK